MSFSINELCPNHMFFEAFENGNGVPYNNFNYTKARQIDTAALTPPDFDFQSELGKRNVVPSYFKFSTNFRLNDEFKIILRIFYDDDFFKRFGKNSIDRYYYIIITFNLFVSTLHT